jgi:manganese/zinc/iron transport system permease protein
MNLLEFFTDPVLRGPTWGTLFMCIGSSLMGAVLMLKKRCLLGESLSHASYPGIVVGASLFALLFPEHGESAFFGVLGGAFATSYLGFKTIDWMEKKGKVRPDAALAFVLALFFGIGTVAASAMQSALPSWKNKLQALMFGQAATMSDFHIVLYAALTSAIVVFLIFGYQTLQAVLFDSDYAKTSGLPVRWVERAIFWLFLFSLILGVRSVGIVLISGMAIAPAVAARQFTDRLHTFFWLSAVFGALSGLAGNISSVLGTIALSKDGERLTLPTGPSIILAGASFALLSLLFAPKRGWIFRICRIASFRFRCLKENVLKAMWKKDSCSLEELQKIHRISPLTLRGILWRLKQGGWIEKRAAKRYVLTPDGRRKAASIVRLHRLWELYLASELGFSSEKIHPHAEEMEHILTPELEERLTRLLADPKVDPHSQPIPEKAVL